ncbi:MAG: hypothetical protein WC708_14900 [Lentisphaeria bacterium]|jgi:hypothetical protein
MSRDSADSYIYRVGSSPNTRVAISQKNRVFSRPYTVNTPSDKQVGVLSTFDYNESRTIDPVRGVGFGDKIQELVPNVTEPMTITLNRTLLYTAGIAQEVGYRGGVDGLVRSLRQHRWPFDLRSELVFSELVTNRDAASILVKTLASDDPNFALITYFEACWLNSISSSFPSDSAIVLEDASATCTDVTDGSSFYGVGPDNYGAMLDSGNNPIIKPGAGSRLYG